MTIAVFGLGYVGSTLAALLARRHQVFALDKNKERAEAVCQGRSPIGSPLMETVLQEAGARLKAGNDPQEALAEAEFVVIATNTELDTASGRLNTASVEEIVERIAREGEKGLFSGRAFPVIVIRSTVPTGFTEKLQKKYPAYSFLFCPEFLREKTAMEDVLSPSRLIIGREKGGEEAALSWSKLVISCLDKEVSLLYTSTAEAEAIKLFSNSYLALRIAFFNELDTFARIKGLDTDTLIKGVCRDPRIGDYYNVPGPGFGGNCLPKDSCQLAADFGEIPEHLIRAAIKANEYRKEFMEGKE